MTITDGRTATFAGRLRAARLLAGYEQAQLAELLGVARNSISNYENGKTDVPASVMIRWAEVTRVSLEWMAWGNEKTPADDSTGVAVRPKGFEPLAFCSVVSLLFVLAAMGPRA